MQLMYVVELSVEGDRAYDRVLSHVADWLSGPRAQLEAADFDGNGSRTLAPARTPDGSFPRHGEWESIQHGQSRGLKIEVTQKVGTALELTTRVSVTEVDRSVRFRVGIGREVTAGRLIPVGATDVYQPGVLRSLDDDEALSLRAEGQLIDRRYLPVRSVLEAQALAEVLQKDKRLPLALIHVRSSATWELARELSGKLLGLARTVTLNFETAGAIAAEHPTLRVPFGGLAIAWPDLDAPPLTLSADKLNELGAQEVRRILAQRLGALAALSYGDDLAWRQLRARAESARLDELAGQAARAREGGDAAGEITALQKQVEALQAAKAELEAIGEDALQQAERNARLVRQLESERDQARDEATMWRESYTDLSAGRSSEQPAANDAWSSIPPLTPRADPEETFLAISDAASERIVFTDRARKSWSDIDYPEPDDMTNKLTALARAAVVLYNGEEKSIPHLDDWLQENFGLTVALTDQTISKWKRKEMRWLNEFEFEGQVLNATPHVKVRDAVKFNECGRIHFALDGKGSEGRLVVQHVGVKTYK